eukprot:1406814-Pleurochrysis_carterae.AAC.1
MREDSRSSLVLRAVEIGIARRIILRPRLRNTGLSGRSCRRKRTAQACQAQGVCVSTHLLRPYMRMPIALGHDYVWLFDCHALARLGMVDATAEEQLAAKHGIEGYPTLLLIEDGLMAEYLGPREEDAIIAFVKAGFTDELKERAVAAPGPPSWLDPVWELCMALHEIRSVACSSSALFAAAMVWLCSALGFGVIIGLASARSEPAFFTAVCPPGLGPAETVAVSIPSRSWWGAHSRTVHVTPPPGIREGQTFFVPLQNSAVRGQVVRKKSV